MSKITKITIENFRAFYGKYEFKIGGKNVLIYGENGSGKSSLFAAVRDFIKSSEPSNNITFDRNIYAAAQDAAHITFELESDSYCFNGLANTNNETIFRDAIILNSWLTYRELLKTYLDIDADNLYPILWEFWIKHLPSQLSVNTLSNALSAKRLNKEIIGRGIKQDTIEYYWEYEVKPLIDNLNRSVSVKKNTKKNQDTTATTRQNILNLTATSPNIKTRIEGVLYMNNSGATESVLERANRWLKDTFKANFEISFDILFDITDIKFTPQITHNSKPLLQNYRSFLNEARLSALATCLYLSMLLDKPQQPNQLKILFLDDIFIGLDMSNRLPLLEILKTEFSDWQIFMTTYDRHWFEVAKQQLDIHKTPSTWLAYEMYVGEKTISTGSIAIPFIKKAENYIELAEFYLKNHQYPECANNLRKALEQKLKKSDFLPSKLLFVEGTDAETGETIRTKQKNLHSLLTIFIKYIEDFGFDKLEIAEFEELKNTKDWYLNPFSHDNIETPIYRAELDRALLLVKKLYNITITKLLNAGEQLYFEFNQNGKNQRFNIKLIDNLYFVKQNAEIKISDPNIECIEWINNGTVNSSLNWGKCLLKKIYNNKKDRFEKELSSINETVSFTTIDDTEIYFHNGQSLKIIIDALNSI